MTMTDEPTQSDVYFERDGIPRSKRFNDVYYSAQDGLSESRGVLLEGIGAPDIWAGKSHFCVGELGFGTGLNIIALIDLWKRTRAPRAHLHIFSIEGFIMSRDEAELALSPWPEVSDIAQALLKQWPSMRNGLHYMDFPQWGVSVNLALMEVSTALKHALPTPVGFDAWFLDGFSPSLNPQMWSDEVLALIAQKSKQGTLLASFSVAGFVRRGLERGGFVCEKKPGFGKKRERLEAVLGADIAYKVLSQRPEQAPKMAVLGAGIAGCALVYQLRLLGFEADIFDRQGPGAGASGNEAGIVAPRLDAGADEIAQLFSDAHIYATQIYQAIAPEAIFGRGLYQIDADGFDNKRFIKIKAQANYADEDLSLFEEGALGDAPKACGLKLQRAMSVSPSLVLEALLAGQAVIKAKITAIRPSNRRWIVDCDAAHKDEYDHVFLACGDGLIDMGDYKARFDLRPVRGQVEAVVSASKPKDSVNFGGYLIPTTHGFVFGATHDRDDRGVDIRRIDISRNQEVLSKLYPDFAELSKTLPINSRASIRVMTRDYMPICGTIEAGLHILTGLGSRGFCMAPLMAKAVVAMALGRPVPLMQNAIKLISPMRSSLCDRKA